MIYLVIDNMGTRQWTWTRKGAEAWLPYCGSVAVIGNAWTGRVIAHRIKV